MFTPACEPEIEIECAHGIQQLLYDFTDFRRGSADVMLTLIDLDKQRQPLDHIAA